MTFVLFMKTIKDKCNIYIMLLLLPYISYYYYTVHF